MLAGTTFGRGAILREDRELFAEIRAADEKIAEITFVAHEGAGPQLAAQLRAVGAPVVASYPEVDVLVARVPLEAVDRLLAVPEILAWRADHVSDGEAGTKEPPILRDGLSASAGPSAGDFALPRLITGADVIGMAEFWRDHPTFDGRGTAALVQDSYVDPVHPNLQFARDLEGRAVRKILTLLPPEARDVGSGWWRCESHGDVAGRTTIELDGRTYRKPNAGLYRFGMLDEEAGGMRRNLYGGDFNRDGNPRGSSSRFGICWDPVRGCAWIDINQNGDFTDDPVLRSYAETGDIALAGVDNPRTPVREVNPYFVEFDPAKSLVWVGAFAVSYHGTAVAGAMAGSGLLGIDLNAPAPAAQIISQRGASLANTLNRPAIVIRDWQQAFREPWDVFQCSEAYDVSRRPSPSARARLSEDPNVFTLALQRWLEKSGRTFVYAAGNEFRSLVAKSDSFGRCGLAVGAYVGREQWSLHFGINPPATDYVAPAGGRGPALDGAVSPEVLAPTGILTLKPVNFPEERFSGPWVLPNGYMFGGGTSTAAPVASGLALALISAAKQHGLPHDGQRIKRALIGGARWLEGIPAHEQGNGLLDAERSWSVLQRLATKESIMIESEGSIRTANSADQPKPNLGVGLYEREGWRPGQQEKRILRFKRLNGPAESESVDVRFKGNDGTFKAPTKLTLPLGQSVDLPVDVAPRSFGVHSALLELTDADGDQVHECMVCIIAAQEFNPDGSLVLAGSVSRPARRSFYVRVPPGAEALIVKQAILHGELFFNYYNPADEEPGYALRYFTAADAIGSRTFAHPAPGVWEISVNNEHDATRFDPTRPPLVDGEFRLELSLKSATGEVQAGNSVVVRSVIGGGQQKLQGLPLVARRREEVTLHRGMTGSAVVDFDVPEGATAVKIRAEAAGADLNLYLFDRTKREPLVWSDALGLNPEILQMDRPPAGPLRVIIDPYLLPADQVEAAITIEISDPDFGMTTTTSDFSRRSAVVEWRASYGLVSGPKPIPSGWIRVACLAIIDADANDHRFDLTQPKTGGPDGGRPLVRSIPIGNVELPSN